MMRSRKLIVILLICAVAPIGFSQFGDTGIYWEYPDILVPSPAKYLKVADNNNNVALVWQESRISEANRGEIYLSLRYKSGVEDWFGLHRFAGPYPFVGREVPIYSAVIDEHGTVYVAILAGSRSVEIYRMLSGETEIREISTIEMAATTVAPHLFIGSNGGLLLFLTQDILEETVEISELEGRGTTAIFYSKSDDGQEWGNFVPFVEDDALKVTLHFLPRHAALGQRDYVVFQSYMSEEANPGRSSNQLFVKQSADYGASWSVAKRLTNYSEVIGGSVRSPGEFDNQNAHLYPVDGKIVMTWERSANLANPQIYYAELNASSDIVGIPERVSQGGRATHAPQGFWFRDRLYLHWFDDREGTEHIILAYKRGGLLWAESVISRGLEGASLFAAPFVLNSELHFAWENRNGFLSSIAYLGPDHTVVAPILRPGDFREGERYGRDSFAVNWNLPADSTGIEGFSVVWDRDPEGVPMQEVTLSADNRSMETRLPEDGYWYAHISAKDHAGNWSKPSTVSVIRDTTPPEQVEFIEPEMDENGYLVSNTFGFSWKPPKDEDLAGYSYRLQYLDTYRKTLEYTAAALKRPAVGINLRTPEISIRNRDNGLWALSVTSIDSVGNAGFPTFLFFRLDKYVPETYITSVGTAEDDLGRISIEIIGRGFNVGGNVNRIVLDTDRKAPWDYVYSFDLGSYRVDTDRKISGLILEGLGEGDYWLGVEHPLRGLHFAPRSLAVEPMGKIKFGDFAATRPVRFFFSPSGKFPLPFNTIVVLMILSLLGFLLVFSFQRMAVVAREGKMLRVEVTKLLSEEMPETQRRERIREMKRKGMGLRVKFSFITILLVISTVLLVAFPLLVIMTNTQERILAEGLEDKAAVMLDSAASGARSYLPEKEAFQLGLLTRQSEGVDEALYITITGEGSTDVENTGYIWATNDSNIEDKINTDDFNLGLSRLDDGVTPLTDGLSQRLEELANQEVSELRKRSDELRDQQAAIFRESVDGVISEEDQQTIRALSDEAAEVDGQILSILTELGNVISSVPEYNSEKLSRELTEYTFYRPIVYYQNDDNRYFHGMVRLGISTEGILRLITTERRNILFTTGIVALLAVGIGIVSALVLSSIIIRPIRRLLRGVEVIRDTEDKEELKQHVIAIRTKDEIADLAEAVNQMTVGLAEAAAANKDLIVGKDTQKMFTPLEQDPNTGRKLTTAVESNDNIEFFGYYEGARGVSGDYFDYAKLDDQHYAVIKCDVAGKGVPASLIMVEVATIFLDYFRSWKLQSHGIHLDQLVYRINDLVEQRGFQGRFAALLVAIINVKSGATYFCHAGDNILHIFNNEQQKMTQRVLPEAPASGVFSSDLIEMGSGFQQIPHVMKSGDILLLFTDGVEEDKRHFLDENFKPMTCAEDPSGDNGNHGNHSIGEDNEEVGISRIYDVINAVMSRGTYELVKYHSPTPGESLVFDFSTCEGTVTEAVLAMTAMDKIFRLIPDPSAGASDRVRIDVKIDEFLRKHFTSYSRYFRSPEIDELFPEYVHFPHLKEDYQYDDLTILGVRKV
ncbi:MAG: serine/threonine protein phosphatase [Spirochaetales bacterium]|nr:serine/threonine protein phosphatase [Spirochaetales bacterium]